VTENIKITYSVLGC